MLATRRQRATFAVQILAGAARLATTLRQPHAVRRWALRAAFTVAAVSGLALFSWKAAAALTAGVAVLGWTLHGDDRARRLALLIRAFRNTSNRQR
jgi:hypothetical protein